MSKYANFIWYSKDTLMSLRVSEDGEYELVFTLTSDDGASSFWFSKYLSSKEAKKLAKAIKESEE